MARLSTYTDPYNEFRTTDLHQYDQPEPCMGSYSNTGKELILLAVYFNPGNFSHAKARALMQEVHARISHITEDITTNTKHYVKFFMMMVTDQPTKIECLYPTSTVSELPLSALESLIENENKNIKL